MDKNQVIGFSLLAVIFIVFTVLNRPTDEEIAAMERERDSIAQVEASQSEIAEDQSETLSSSDSQSATDKVQVLDSNNQVVAPKKEEYFTLENDKLLLKVSNKGGHVVYAQLKEYNKFDSTELILVNAETNDLSFTYNETSSTSDLWFEASSVSDNSLALTATDGGSKVTYNYNLSDDSYDLDFNTEWSGSAPNQLVWNQKLLQQEKRAESERLKSTIYFKEAGDKPDYVSERKNDDEEILDGENSIEWISFKQQFFNQALVYDDGFKSGTLKQGYLDGEDYIKDLHATMLLDQKASHNFKMIFIPNLYPTLKTYDISLERVVYLGWGIFGWVNRFLVIPIFSVLSKVTNNYGLIIAILTIIFKGLLLFFTYKSFLSGAKMRLLKPELDIIKKKNDGDMQAQQAEQMKLYQATGVSPLGGCLPMLVQMPILLALFNFFPNSFELRQQSFLWVPDLSTYDAVITWGGHIPIIDSIFQNHISLFALLMTISTFVYTLINQSYQPQQQKELKYLPYIMPFIFFTFLNNYSAALSYYYFLANLISIGQTFLFKAFINEDKLRAQLEENRKKKAAGGATASGGGMQGRMQAWMEKQQKKQQALQQQQRSKKK